MKINKILITGSSGTIGTRLFESLLEKKYQVVGFDKQKNIWHESLDKLTVQGNLLNAGDFERLPHDIDVIVHLAANARVHDLVLDPELARDNMEMTYRLLAFAKQRGISRIVFSGSREVYGNRKKMTAAENDVDIALCESPYAASKISNEVLIHSFAKCYGLHYIIHRFSNVYGRYDMSDRFIPLLVRKMKNNEPIEIFGKDKTLDFTYIDDCVAAVVLSIERFDRVQGNVFNIASGRGQTLTQVAQLMKKKLDSKSKIVIRKNRTGEVVQFIANIAKAKKMLGYRPQYSLEQGLELALEWYNGIVR
jgi:UDP-glucose 4-epimerase